MKLLQVFRMVFTGDRQACESCRSAFTCGPAIAGCWCGKVRLSEKARRELRAKYRGCVCPNCLHGAAQPETTR